MRPPVFAHNDSRIDMCGGIGMAEQWSQQKQWLVEAKEEISQRLERSGQYGLDDTMADELSELSVYDNHPADIGTEVFERSKDLALRDTDKLRLQQIDRALDSIENGTYGTCSECRQPIAVERLEAFPLATTCVQCQRKVEETHPDRQRPIEEEFLYPGYGRTDTDDTSAVVFDGEDSWQAVERYNERPGYEHNYEQIFLDDNEGIVDSIDEISNEQYRQQLP